MSSPELPGRIVLRSPGSRSLVSGPPASSGLIVVPTPGPKGDTGTPGGAYFAFAQTTPASTWIIDHNLNKKVHISLFDDLGRLVYADVEHGSPNQATITFPSPTTGSGVAS